MIAHDIPGARNQPGMRDEKLRQDPFWFILRALWNTAARIHLPIKAIGSIPAFVARRRQYVSRHR